MMTGIHMFRRNRTSQVIKCNPWSTRLCLYPSLIWKMKTYVELEGKLGPKPRPQPQTQSHPSTSTPPPNNNPMTRKSPGPKMNENKRRTRVPAKRRYKVRVIAQPIPTTPTPTAPVNSAPIVHPPTIATNSIQMPVVKSAATSIPVMVYNLTKGKFDGVPYPTEIPQTEKNPSIHNFNPPPLEAIPNAPTFQVREDTPWPNTESASMNLLEARADWPIPPTPTPTKTKVPPQIAAVPHAMVMPKQIGEKCTWRPHCPICVKERGRRHGGLEWWQAEWSAQESPSTKCSAPQSYDVPDRYPEQIRLKREWDKKMECLNEKYGLDYYSSSESNCDFEPEHKYETFIWT